MKLYLLFLFLMISNALMGQSGKIQGIVSTYDNKPAEYINVVIKGSSKGAITNSEGEFVIEKVTVGKHILVISFVGLESKELVVEVAPNETTLLDNIILNETKQKLDEVVISGSKSYKVDQPSNSLRLQTPLLETPQNIQVISGKVIEDQQIFDILEGITRNVSGVTKVEHWDNYARLNMRGSQIAAFRNGMNVQMPWGPIAEDMSMVERVEFVKGPAGFMMANGEPSGFYNVVTKKPTGINKGEVDFTIGSFDTYRAALDLDGKFNEDGKLLYRLNLMGQIKGSHRDYEYNNRYSIAPVLTYRFNDKTSLTAEYTYQFMEMSVIGSAYVFSANGYADVPVNFTTAEPNLEPSKLNDHSMFLIFNHQINPTWNLTAQLAYFNYNQEGSSLWPSSVNKEGFLERGVSIWDAFNESTIGQVFVNGEVETAMIKHRILAGLDLSDKNYMADWGQGFTLGTAEFNIYDPNYGVYGDDLPEFDRSKSLRARAGTNVIGQSTTGIYLQDELSFLKDKVRLTLAGRYTTVEETKYGNGSNDKALTPRVGLSVSLTKGTSLYALYDQAFVPQIGYDSLNMKTFDPIEGNNIEAGVKKDWFGGLWNSTLSIYQITKSNAITAVPGKNWSTQLGETQVKGVEIDLQGRVLPGLDLILNYALTNSEITKDTNEEKVGDLVPGFAKHITNGWLSYRFNKKSLQGLGVSIGYQWQIDRTTWSWTDSFDGEELKDYFRLDGAVTWQNKNLHVGLNVYNLLDDYLYSGSPYDVNWDGVSEYYWQAEAPLNFRLNVGYKF